MPSDTKPLPEPMLTQICLHTTSLHHNELNTTEYWVTKRLGFWNHIKPFAAFCTWSAAHVPRLAIVFHDMFSQQSLINHILACHLIPGIVKTPIQLFFSTQWMHCKLHGRPIALLLYYKIYTNWYILTSNECHGISSHQQWDCLFNS